MKIALDDSVLTTLHRDLQQVRVGSIGKMDVYLSAFGPVEASEFIGEVLGCGIVVVGCSGVVWEIFRDRLLGKLFLEQVNLVQEKDDR